MPKMIYAFTGKNKDLREDIKSRLDFLRRLKYEAKMLGMVKEKLGWR